MSMERVPDIKPFGGYINVFIVHIDFRHNFFFMLHEIYIYTYLWLFDIGLYLATIIILMCS